MISSSENDSGGNSWTPEIPFESLTEVTLDTYGKNDDYKTFKALIILSKIGRS